MTTFHGLNSYSSTPSENFACVKNFRWVLNGKLARSSQPYYTSTDKGHTVTQADIQRLKERNIVSIISANKYKIDDAGKKRLADKNNCISYFHFETEDFGAPSKERLLRVASLIELFGRRGTTLVYCGFGAGRTGTLVSAWAMLRHLKDRTGVDIEALCNLIDLKRHFGVEEPCQVNAVRDVCGLPPYDFTKSAASTLPIVPMGFPSADPVPIPPASSFFSAGPGAPPMFTGFSTSGGAMPPLGTKPLSVADVMANKGAAFAKFSSGSSDIVPPPPPSSGSRPPPLSVADVMANKSATFAKFSSGSSDIAPPPLPSGGNRPPPLWSSKSLPSLPPIPPLPPLGTDGANPASFGTGMNLPGSPPDDDNSDFF